MKLLICGSAAAEAVPGLFCTCPLCLKALKEGGKDIRSRTAYQLGEKIRIDFGPDTFYHMVNSCFKNMPFVFITNPPYLFVTMCKNFIWFHFI